MGDSGIFNIRTLGVDFRPLGVNFRPLEVELGLKKLIYGLMSSNLGGGSRFWAFESQFRASRGLFVVSITWTRVLVV